MCNLCFASPMLRELAQYLVDGSAMLQSNCEDQL